jgi:dienelactone hydrolase
VFRRILTICVIATLSACSAGTAPPTAPNTPAPSVPAVTAPATATPGHAPATSLSLGVRTLKLHRGADRPLPTKVWYPKTGGPYPLIIFSHGLTARPDDYADLLTTWAEAGFVVAAPAFPHTSAGARDFQVLDVLNQPDDAEYVLTQVLTEFGDRIDPSRVAAAGHSAGAITTIGMFSGQRDKRLVAGVVLAGRQVLSAPFTGPAAPLLFVHGKRDETVAYTDGRAAYDAVHWPKAFLTVTAGRHVTTRSDFGVVAATTTDFWRWTLYGDRSAKARLPGDATKGGIATLTDKL